MECRDLEGKKHKINLSLYKTNANVKKSSLHTEARQKIKNIYPTLQILEEVSVHLTSRNIVYLDFFLPLINKCIEVHGEQHYKFTPFYHTTKFDFLKQQKRDREKQEWCEINNIQYVELPFDEIENWEGLIKNEKH